MDNSNSTIVSLQRKTPPYRVFSTWEIHYACNYHCSYCHAPKPWHKDVPAAVYLTVKELMKAWEDIYKRYGSWYILISGGEPSAYPNFLKLITNLSQIHFVELCTNLSWDVIPFIDNINPKMVKVGTSFHPEFADLNVFIDKVKLLKEKGFNADVNFVPHPTLLSRLSEYKDRFGEAGIQFKLQPFIGDYEKRRYPQGYTENEKKYFEIFEDECNINTLDFKTTEKSNTTQGQLCRMGQNYSFIHPDGEVHRCCKDKTISLGNIFKGTFALLEEPVSCNAQECNCNRCMLVGKEDFWSRNWHSPDLEEKISIQASRIALIQPPVWGIYSPPMALAQIASCLKRDSFEVFIFDLNIELYGRRIPAYDTAWAIEQSAFWANKNNVQRFFQDNHEFIKSYINNILEKSPGLIGFSVNVCSFPATLELARLIKQKNPNIKVIVGGPMFYMPTDYLAVLNDGSVDIIILGEGEETFSNVAALLRNGFSLDNCQGIVFKKSGKIIKTEKRQPIKELNGLPFLDLKEFPWNKYDPPGHIGKHISLMTSRGCVLNCVYCGPKAYWQGFRYMSGKRIYEEVVCHLANMPDIKHIDFLDLEFNGNINALNEFCDLMITGFTDSNIIWHANIIIRPEMDRELLFKMKKAGCQHLSIGIESGSQRVLGLMRKNYRIDDAQKVLQYAYEAGIKITTNFMFGFPGETEEDFQLTLEFIRRNACVVGTVYPSRTCCTIEPFSYLAEHMDEFKIIPNPNDNLYWELSNGNNNYPERLRRCDEFCRVASELGISVGSGLQTSVEANRWYSLGYYYDSKKDLVRALAYFKRYLKRDSKNTSINYKVQEICSKLEIPYLNNSDLLVGRYQSNNTISFNWDISWICNYRCPYCWFFGLWPELKSRNRIFCVNELTIAWSSIYKKYGAVKISITGGEPFLYPGFTEIIKELTVFHKVEIISNLSVDIQGFLKEINSEDIIINPSFHPLFADFDTLLERVRMLKDRDIMQCVSLIAWPPQIPLIPYYADKFAELDVSLSVQSFFGEYLGQRYPDSYTEKEKDIISQQIGERGGKKFQTEPLSHKGKLCAAGQRYGVIHPDGNVLRCGGMASNDVSSVGNLFDAKFTLFDQPSPCTFEICPCNEWALLLL